MRKALLAVFLFAGFGMGLLGQSARQGVAHNSRSAASASKVKGKSSSPEDYKTKWTTEPFDLKVFVENKGQFDTDATPGAKVLYACTLGKLRLFFTATHVIYRYDEYPKPDSEEMLEKFDERPDVKPIKHFLTAEWKDANPEVKLEASQGSTDFYIYPTGPRTTVNAKKYKKITYRNIYPNIDIEYTFPEGKEGIEYALIVRPGGDISQVKLNYIGAQELKKDQAGNAILTSVMGEFNDHAPVSYYEGEKNNTIKVSYAVIGTEESFSAGETYDKTKTLIIDPWTTNPLFTGPYDNAYDLDYDNAGNVYAYGGEYPWQLVKLSPAGTIVWTFNTTVLTSNHYGDFAVDKKTGTCYVVEGYSPGGAQAIKINTAGSLLGTLPANPAVNEMWRATYNSCADQVIIGAGGTSGTTQAFVLDTNMVTITPVNVIGTANCCHDIALIASDPSGGSAYMAAVQNCCFTPGDCVVKLPLPTLAPTTFNVPDGYLFTESTSIFYYSPSVIGYGGAIGMGMNGMAASNNWLYMYDGSTLKRLNKGSGAITKSNTISAPVTTWYASYSFFSIDVSWGGLDVDACDNLYAGLNTNIKVYDSTLTFKSSIALSNTVYDVVLGANYSIVYACGKGFVSAITIVAPSASITKTRTPAPCACTGTATATLNLCGSPVTTGITYLWSNGQTTSNATGLCTGVYTITITQGGCGGEQYSDTVNIAGGGGGLTLTTSSTPSTCTANTGTATVTAAGGTAPYTYLWSNGQTSSTATSLSTGTYCVTVKDNTGCKDSVCVTVGNSGGITVTIGPITNVSCSGGNNGASSETTVGGTTPYTYSWSNGQTTSNATGLTAGSYTLTVTDANGCTATVSATITQPAPLTATINPVTNVSCNGGSNGSASGTGAGGTAPYNYNWSSGQTSSNATGLSAGSYTLTLTDANGCSATASTTITQPPALTSTITSTPAACGSNNGTATVTPSGGTGAYTYLWNPTAQTNATATGLTSGTYSVTITDANGCTATTSVVVGSTGSLTASITASTNISCNGGNNGNATVTATTGTAPYTYLWNPTAQTNGTASNLSAGSYTVTVTDANGCTATASVTLTQPAQLRDSIISISNVLCFGQKNGTATVGVKGGTPAYTYAWTPGGGSAAAASGLSAGTYTVTVTDANGCIVSASAVITEPPALKLTASAFPTSCNGGSNGQATVIPSGGTNPYTYSWSTLPIQTNANASNLSAGTYTITVTDAGGCSNDTVVIVTQPAPIVVAFTADTSTGCYPLCFNFKDASTDPNGIITKYNWNFGDGGTDTLQNPRHCYNAPGVYSVSLTVIDNKGCTNTLTTVNMITVYDHPHADFAFAPQPATLLFPTITFTDKSTDLYGIVSWFWQFNDPTNEATSTMQNPVHAYGDTGVFCPQLTVTNIHGCVDSITECLVISPQYTLYIPDAFTPNGDGLNDIFMPKGQYINDYSLYIFDRWGLMIFHSTDIRKGWDGSLGGNICQEDTYVYLINVTDNLGKTHAYIGKVSLIR